MQFKAKLHIHNQDITNFQNVDTSPELFNMSGKKKHKGIFPPNIGAEQNTQIDNKANQAIKYNH